MMRAWPLESGPMSRNEYEKSVSISLKLGMSPLMILQKMQLVRDLATDAMMTKTDGESFSLSTGVFCVDDYDDDSLDSLLQSK